MGNCNCVTHKAPPTLEQLVKSTSMLTMRPAKDTLGIVGMIYTENPRESYYRRYETVCNSYPGYYVTPIAPNDIEWVMSYPDAFRLSRALYDNAVGRGVRMASNYPGNGKPPRADSDCIVYMFELTPKFT